MNAGPTTPAAIATFQRIYCQRGEGHRDVCNRVASALSDNPGHFFAFRDILRAMRFVPGGRVLATMGTTKHTTPYNCFVSGSIGDWLTGPDGIMRRCEEAARTMQMGGGIGYDFSSIRPRGDRVRSMEGRASGPVSYMHVFNSMGKTISSAGERRGAQMGILRIDHPDVEEFILSKQNADALNSFNISLGVTDAFMQALLSEDDTFELKFEGRVYREIAARTLWESVMRSAWDWAEPGVIFLDRINYWNNLGYCETIAATNPCSEQPLPPYGACLLGAFNLVQYLRSSNKPTDIASNTRYWFDRDTLAEDIPYVIRAMDNIVDCALYPLKQQEKEAKNKRRMGIGVMGMANCIEALGARYGSSEAVQMAESIMEFIKNECYSASADLAAEKGAFPLFNRAEYLKRPFIEGLSDRAIYKINKHGIRNSHLLTIAPTGTTAFCMDNVSSGIEPVFSASETRRVIVGDGYEHFNVTDYGMSFLGIVPTEASKVTALEHIDMLCACQRHVDSSISKTCNVPGDMPWADFKDLYTKAWRYGAKGLSVFQTTGKREGIRVAADKCEGAKCQMPA